MWKRRRTWILLLVLTGVALAVYFEPTHCVRGWLWGEAFFEGRPTSYWRAAINDDLHIDPKVRFERAPPGSWDRFKNWIGFWPEPITAQPLVDASNASPVLESLTLDGNQNIAAFAKDVLKYHGTLDRPRCSIACNEGYFAWIRLVYKHNYVDQGVAEFFD